MLALVMLCTYPPTAPLGVVVVVAVSLYLWGRRRAVILAERTLARTRVEARREHEAIIACDLMKDGTVDVYIDSAPENITPDLALRAECVLEDRWNGWLRPLATADAFGAFLDAWRRNDPNGIWGYATEVGDTLVCSVTDSDEPADEFPRAGETADGAPLYDFTGWAWISPDHYDAR